MTPRKPTKRKPATNPKDNGADPGEPPPQVNGVFVQRTIVDGRIEVAIAPTGDVLATEIPGILIAAQRHAEAALRGPGGA